MIEWILEFLGNMPSVQMVFQMSNSLCTLEKHISHEFSAAEAQNKINILNTYFMDLEPYREMKHFSNGIYPSTGFSASDFKVVMQVLIDGLTDAMVDPDRRPNRCFAQDLPLAMVGLFDDSSAAVRLVSDFADFYKLCKSQEFPVQRLDRMDR